MSVRTVLVPVLMTMHGPEMLYPWLESAPKDGSGRLTTLDEQGLPRVGVSVKGGTLLVGKLRPRRPLNAAERELADHAIHHAGLEGLWEEAPYVAGEDEEGVVRSAKVVVLTPLDPACQLNPLVRMQRCEGLAPGVVLERVEVGIEPAKGDTAP